jgi:hypothetical protein
MKDLYKRLGIPPTASAEEIRVAIGVTDEAATREAAEFILLAPRRRTVYDRNHRVMTMIGQLRGRLAMGLRPFWSHGDHRDFTAASNPVAAAGASGRGAGGGAAAGRDPISVIGAAGGHEHGHMRRRRRMKIRAWMAWGLAVVAVVLIAIVVIGWLTGR